MVMVLKGIEQLVFFTFNSAKSIKNIDFVGTDLFMVVEEANGTTFRKDTV